MIRVVERLCALTALFAAATWVGAWWTVPLVAMAWAALARSSRSWEAGLAAFLAWATLLGLGAPAEPTRELVRRLAGVFGTPGFVLGLVTPLYAGLLGWSAAEVSAGLLRRRGGRGVTGPG